MDTKVALQIVLKTAMVKHDIDDNCMFTTYCETCDALETVIKMFPLTFEKPKDELGRFLGELIRDAVGMSGTFNPDETMYIFEEKLNMAEYTKVRDFLTWVHAEGKTFGWNYEEVYAEYLTTLQNEV